MHLRGYMNSPTEPEFIALRHGMEYLMNLTNKNIIYLRKNIFKLNERPHKCFFKADSEEIKKIRNNPTLFTYNTMQIIQ